MAGCCSFPHGGCSTFWTFIVMTAGCWLSFTSLYGCEFFEGGGEKKGTHYGLISVYLPGFTNEFTNSNYDHCFYYNSYYWNGQSIQFDFDTPFNIARAFGWIAMIISIIFWIASCSLCCVTWDNFIKKMAGTFLLIACACQGLTFLVFLSTHFCGEEQDCSMAWGAYVTIAAAAFLFISALSICKLPEPDRDDGSNERVDTTPLIINETRTETTETIGEDGSKVVTTTTFNPDGTVTTKVKTFTPEVA